MSDGRLVPLPTWILFLIVLPRLLNGLVEVLSVRITEYAPIMKPSVMWVCSLVNSLCFNRDGGRRVVGLRQKWFVGSSGGVHIDNYHFCAIGLFHVVFISLFRWLGGEGDTSLVANSTDSDIIHLSTTVKGSNKHLCTSIFLQGNVS